MKFLVVLFSLFSFSVFSQNFCITDEYNKLLIEESPKKYDNIESKLQQYLKNKKQKSIGEIVIPIVFHVVWIDDRQNLDDSVIHHQLDVLNRSFNKKNSDTIILTDTLKNWIGDFNIRFELAYIDPLGDITNGITRTKTINPHFSYFGDHVKKSHYGKSPWPTDRYLNVWVCNLLDGFHGYAQFPGGPNETDGVVVDWQTVGNGNYPWTYPNSDNLACGKVLVHEIGHWLNLYHPWGNTTSGCGDDHIPETGLQYEPVYHTHECHDTLFSFCNPSERVFVKHYMDYSGCDCMVTFTKNQVERGLASLYTYREDMIDNYEPKPIINYLEETKVNPTLTEGIFYIHLPKYNGIIEVSIFDISGKLIEYRQLYETTFNIFDISNNSSGMYFIKINDNNFTLTKKILKN